MPHPNEHAAATGDQKSSPGEARLERRSLAPELSAIALTERAEGQPPLIAGYAAVYYDPANPGTEFKLWSDAVERIMPGAFDRAVKEDDVRALFNHQPSMILGRTVPGTLRLSVDSKGLRYEIEPPDTQIGRDLVTSIKRKDVTGSSFAFIVTDERPRKVKSDPSDLKSPDLFIREIHGVKLFDVGPVVYPAYEATTTGLRDADLILARRSLAGLEEHEQRAAADLKARLHRRSVQVRLREIEAGSR
jgi:hypothetical protein